MIPIPPPREAGFTTTTDVPLYWLRYGKPGATPLLVLHGGPGAHHDYLLPQFLDLADEYESGHGDNPWPGGMLDLPNATTRGGMLYVFALP